MTLSPRESIPLSCAILFAVAPRLASAHDGHAHHDGLGDHPHPTAGPAGPVATLRYDVGDASGAAIPMRLTFVAADGSLPKLFPNTNAAPNELAVRQNMI